MKSVRRPAVALGTTLVLVALQAIADPTGLLALVGWSGAQPDIAHGIWPFAPYLVFLPVLLVVVWWAALRAGDRYWTLVPGIVLAVLLAQAAACLVMTGNLGIAAWAGGYVTAKAVPAALIIAAFTRWFGGKAERKTVAGAPLWPATASVALWLPAVLFAALAPLLSGMWWTAAAYGPWVPVARPDRGALSVIVAMLLIAAVTIVVLRWMRARVPGVLGGWLAALVASGIVGLVQAVVAFVTDNGFAGDLWPLMTAYVAVADGLSFGATVGWVVGLGAVVTERVLAGREEKVRRLALAAVAGLAVISLGISVLLPVVTPASASSDVRTGFLRAEGSIITDGDGNQVLLRGVNVNQLVDFYRPRADVDDTRPLTEDDFAGIAEQGFNVVRLNISWSALEPERGEYDAEYLAQITTAVGWAKEHGIYTVIDMHQDSWFNGATEEGTECRPGTDPMWGYDGAPAWATITDGGPRCQFQGRDISPAGNRAFQHFYFDTDGVQTALAEAWGVLAALFKDEPAVAGYNLLNEPGFGETAPVTTSYLLGRFSDKAIQQIRAAGAPQIVFVEPSILWSGLGFDSGPTPGFTSDPNIVFAPHLYAESLTMDRALGIPPIVGMPRQFELAERVAASYHAPLWSGEYGYWGDQPWVVEQLTRYAALEDEHVLGSAYWVWKQACGDPQNGIGDTGNGLMVQDCATGGDAPPRDDLLAILSRAYPRSAPGVITSLKADGAHIALAGTTAERSCGLEVWVPGALGPTLNGAGITDIEMTEVAGGWLVTGCATGDYALSSAGYGGD